jgi:hypothetical protein
MAANWQHILVYLALAIAVGYLLLKFVWPEVARSRKPGSSKDCGSPDCGCR